MEYLEANPIWVLKERSVEDQMLSTYVEVTDRVDSGSVVIVFIDFSKVFDVVRHFIIFIKGQILCVMNWLLSWVTDYCRPYNAY